jgi:hypothetical protein
MKDRLQYDPKLAEKLIPDFAPGCKRLTPGDGYLEAFEKVRTHSGARVDAFECS